MKKILNFLASLIGIAGIVSGSLLIIFIPEEIGKFAVWLCVTLLLLVISGLIFIGNLTTKTKN